MHSKSKPVSSYNQYSATYSSQTKPLTVTSSSYKPNQTSGVGKEGPRAGSMTSGVKSGPKNTSKDMEERRAKRLCFWCDERYTPQHKCPKRRVYSLQLLEEEEGDFELPLEVTEEVSTDLQLSLHAMWGLEGNQIMRIKGESQGRQLKVLIDTGSTHNFLSQQVAKRLECDLVQVYSTAVEVANGLQLSCDQKCKNFPWEMQDTSFMTEVYVIALETYDLILGVQWLSTLGDISWNFCTLQMTFEIEGVLCTLQGEKWSSKGRNGLPKKSKSTVSHYIPNMHSGQKKSSKMK